MGSMNRDYWPTTAWRTANPELLRVDPLRLLQAEQAVRVKFRGANAFLVVKNGYLILEKYYNGFDQMDSHHVISITKSVMSALIGIAIDHGCIQSVEQRIWDFFPEFPLGKHDVLKGGMTIQHLLTMTTGFLWRGGVRETMMDPLWKSKNWVEFILNLPVKKCRFGKFQYNSAVAHLLSAILTRATNMPAQEFANAHLFRAIGASRIPAVTPGNNPCEETRPAAARWAQDPQGINTGGWGLALRPRDMARFGFLYLNEGQWDKRQIISKRWITDSLRAHTPGYGYQWWLREIKGFFVYAAVGRGGQHIFCIPEMDMVIVIVSKAASKWIDRWSLLRDHIIPAVK